VKDLFSIFTPLWRQIQHHQSSDQNMDSPIYGVTIWVEKRCIEKIQLRDLHPKPLVPRKTFGQENSIKKATKILFGTCKV